jgi:5-methyltetrahydrofolate--homocysteine methyltransferase
MEAMRQIRQELPECHILLGVSNISFWVECDRRQVLNSVFLHEAMQVGMDGAIVSANKILSSGKN